ncbi:c-type cytochrome [Pedobacter sp. 22226]|uniref:c-type cytochrome n=1 Tax=Pedobacter sp. 22226 TaxID=3453894 RepID=UPI003F84A696
MFSLAIGCTNSNKTSIAKTDIPPRDTCGPWYSAAGNDIRDSKGSDLAFDIGCNSCHPSGGNRTMITLPTFEEISRIDSLKLRDFIFISKHKGYFKKEPALNYKIKKIDSLSDCDRKNLIHYIKNQSRIIVHVLQIPNDPSDTVPVK